jgi:GrpB-like predicted nucleotidyltransferase (UPF0157 family)
MNTLTISIQETHTINPDIFKNWVKSNVDFCKLINRYFDSNKKFISNFERKSFAFYSLQEYDKNWPKKAQEHIDSIKKDLDSCGWFCDIQHVGSTSVPGLAAKPCIDLIMGVRSRSDLMSAIKYLKNIGYFLSFDSYGNPCAYQEYILFLYIGKDGSYYSIFLTLFDNFFWKDKLLFRDYLRKHPEERNKYEEVKKRIHSMNKPLEEYTRLKKPHIDEMKQKARAELQGGSNA